MPRQARKKSKTGIYHVMLRGINQQQIFEDNEDYDKFLQILKDCKAISEFKLFAYCLMGNQTNTGDCPLCFYYSKSRTHAVPHRKKDMDE